MSLLDVVACPICEFDGEMLPARHVNPTTFDEWYTGLGFGDEKNEWKACGQCGFVHLNPRPSVEMLNEYYAKGLFRSEYPSWMDDRQRYMQHAESYYRAKIEYTIKHSGLKTGSIFDFGFGHGGVLQLFQEAGWTAKGIEPDPAVFEKTIRMLDLENLDCGIFDANYTAAEQVDVAFSNHTFEHVANLHDVMRGFEKLVKPGGLLVTIVPTYNMARSPFAIQSLGVAHYSSFTHQSLNQLLAHYGFEEVHHTYNGWETEKFDLWHVARNTGNRRDPSEFYEDPQKVQHYLNVTMPRQIAMHSFKDKVQAGAHKLYQKLGLRSLVSRLDGTRAKRLALREKQDEASRAA